MGVPMVVAHAVHPLTYGLGRMLISGVRHIALPNILAGASVVPERVQDLDPAELCRLLLDCPPSQPVDLRPLGAPGASKRAADALVEGIRARR
jgi:lipid A disaccharide synthetase